MVGADVDWITVISSQELVENCSQMLGADLPDAVFGDSPPPSSLAVLEFPSTARSSVQSGP